MSLIRVPLTVLEMEQVLERLLTVPMEQVLGSFPTVPMDHGEASDVDGAEGI